MKAIEESLLSKRQSVRTFESGYTIPKEHFDKIFELTLRAPSSKNLQHWRFIVFSGDEVKEKLFFIANEQKMVREASAIIAVLGDTEAYRNGEHMLNEMVINHKITGEQKEEKMKRIMNTYENRGPGYPLEAAQFNGGLAAMQLLLAITELGYGACPIGGFNKGLFKKEFQIDKRYEPLILVPIGKIKEEGRKTSRLPISHFVEFRS